MAAVIVAVVVAGGYLDWASATGNPPFCPGYTPGGSCPSEISYAFAVEVNYTGSWSMRYYGYSSIGNPNGQVFSAAGSFAGGNLTGEGPYNGSVTLKGPSNRGLTLCVSVDKLDTSNLSLTVTVENASDNTTLPNGSAWTCESVVQ